jgi:Flp pilus assembly protein TadD
MLNRPRIGTRLLAAWALALIASAPALSGPVTRAPSADEAKDASPADSAAERANALLLDIKPVLAHDYAGIDTAALLGRIQERLKWGERDDRLVEAEGIIHWDRGDAHLAVPCFKRLAAPGPFAMRFLAEAYTARGEKYEAAGWYLRAARASRPGDPASVELYRKYLEIRPADAQAELELAGRLEDQMRFDEAGDLYWKHRDRLLKDTAAAVRVADMISAHGRLADAAALILELRAAHPEAKSLSVRLAGIREAQGDRVAAAAAWTDAWSLDAADSTARNRALAHLEASGPAGEAPLKELLEKALRYDSASAALHFRLAVLQLKGGDRKGAYAHLDLALRASPGNPTYLARLPEAIEGDSLILVHAALLKSRFERDPASPRLALLAARAYSLAGDKPAACKTWARVAAADAKSLDGRRDAFLDLTACGDPASLQLASAIGSKQLAAGFDRDAARAMIPIALKSQDYARAADYASRLAIESPGDAPDGLAAAKAMLLAGRDAEARQVLKAIAEHAPAPEAAMLLGRLYHASKEWAKAAEQFRVARDSFPEAPRLLGECLAELKDYPGAASEYQAHYARTGDKESLRAAARMYRAANDPAKETEALQALEAKGGAGDEERLRLGLAMAAQGDTRAAMAAYEELFRGRASLPAGSGWSDAALQYGIQMARDGKLDKASHALAMGLKAAPAGTPGLSEPWMRLGECLAEKKQWREAYAAYASALAADSNSGEAAAEMLNAARKFDGKKEMADAYRAVYRLDTLNADANAALAASHQAAHEYREAAVHYRRVVDARPTDAKAWENLGNALAMIPDLKAASGPLQTAIDLGAQSDEVYVNRARAYRVEGAKDMAASILEFLLNRDSHDYLAVLWSAKFAEEDGNQAAASDLFRKTAKLTAPHSPWPELTHADVKEAKTAARAD